MVFTLILTLALFVVGCGPDATVTPCRQEYSDMPSPPRLDAERILDGPTDGTTGLGWIWYENFDLETGSCDEVIEGWEWFCDTGWELIHSQLRHTHPVCPKDPEDWP